MEQLSRHVDDGTNFRQGESSRAIHKELPTVEDAPGERGGAEAGKPPRAQPEAEELYGAGGHSADAEQPPLVAVLVGQRAEQHHGVEVDVRVEKRQRRAHRPDVHHRDRRRFSPW